MVSVCIFGPVISQSITCTCPLDHSSEPIARMTRRSESDIEEVIASSRAAVSGRLARGMPEIPDRSGVFYDEIQKNKLSLLSRPLDDSTS